MPKIQDILDSLKIRNQRFLQVALRKWFDFTQKQIRKDLTSKYTKSADSITSNLTDWELIESNGITTIKPAAVDIMQTGGDAAYKHLAVEGSFDVLNVPAVKAVNKFCSKLVTDVTVKTKKGINTFIRHGIKQGWSMSKIARELRPLVGLTGKQTQAIIKYRSNLMLTRSDLTAAQLDKAVMRYTNKVHRQRMLTIARTETANAQNIGYCQGLEQVGVKEAELRNGANPCEECLALKGVKFPIAEAGGIITVHPRCTCAMLPVIDDKVISERLGKPHPKLSKAEIEKAEVKIEPIDPPQFAVVLKRYGFNNGMDQKQAMRISQGLRKTYPKKLTTRNFGEMENAILNYEAARTLAIVDKEIVGAISFWWDEVSKNLYIAHTGTLMSPKGTGAELVRTAVETAYKGRWGMYLESTYEAIDFWKRLGFIQDKKVLYVFNADFKRVSQIREALGFTGRVKEKTGA